MLQIQIDILVQIAAYELPKSWSPTVNYELVGSKLLAIHVEHNIVDSITVAGLVQ